MWEKHAQCCLLATFSKDALMGPVLSSVSVPLPEEMALLTREQVRHVYEAGNAPHPLTLHYYAAIHLSQIMEVQHEVK